MNLFLQEYLVRASRSDRNMQVLARRLFKQDLASLICKISQELASSFFSKMILQVLERFHDIHLGDIRFLEMKGHDKSWNFMTYHTMFLSFLKRERDFANVSDHLSCSVWSLHTVHRSWPLPWSFLSVPDRLRNGQKLSTVKF